MRAPTPGIPCLASGFGGKPEERVRVGPTLLSAHSPPLREATMSSDSERERDSTDEECTLRRNG